MSALLFLPWCCIEKPYQVGDITLIPYDKYDSIPGLDTHSTLKVRTILAAYKDLQGSAVDKACLIQYKERNLLDELTDDEIETVFELVELACFSGLANRQYFSQIKPYCNSDCFSLYVQKFSDNPTFVAINTRRREGRTQDGWNLDEVTFTIPLQTATINKVELDEDLLPALISLRNTSSDDNWVRWQNAISCYNQANTDSNTVRYQIEWVLLCSAFEHLLQARTDARDVARRFSEAFPPLEEINAIEAKRNSDRWAGQNASLRYEWMREFYRLRGDFAHGRLQTQQPAVWGPLEHIVLGSIAFPLVVRSLLSKEGHYTMSQNDANQIDAFEKLADEDFINRPPDPRNSEDSWWRRLLSDAAWQSVTRDVERSMEAMAQRNDQRDSERTE